MPHWSCPLLCISLVAPVYFVHGGESALMVTADFPGGSAEVKSVDAEKGAIEFHPAVHEGQGWPCWWYFRVDGLKAGQTVTLKLSGNPKPYRGKTVLTANWSQPGQAVFSSDNVTWQQTAKCRRENGVAIYEFQATAGTMWVAWGPPFLPSHAEQLLERIAKQRPGSERFTLARTRGDRPVTGIRIGEGKLGVWVQARQHAWEAGSSWVGQGFIEWAAGDDPDAVELRKQATIYFIPIMDVDNVAQGAGGKEAVPRDQNRDWSDKPVYPEVAAAQQKIRELNEAGRFDLFLDLHNPGPGEPRPYFYGPFNMPELPKIQQQNHARFIALAAAEITAPLKLDPQYRIASYVKTDEERNRMSQNWVRNHTAPHVLSATLETAWDTPQSTQEGYQAVGSQLARAVQRYLEGNPRGN